MVISQVASRVFTISYWLRADFTNIPVRIAVKALPRYRIPFLSSIEEEYALYYYPLIN